jgi:hypothetical protein
MIPTAFDRWFDETLEREGLFTLFLIVMLQQATTIVPQRSTFLHVIGPDVSWSQLADLIGDEPAWDCVAIFAARAPAGGPLPDETARQRLQTLDAAVLCDRLTVRRGELFDRHGRRLDLALAPH